MAKACAFGALAPNEKVGVEAPGVVVSKKAKLCDALAPLSISPIFV